MKPGARAASWFRRAGETLAAALAGGTLAAGLSRLLYEAAPLRFAGLGAPGVVLALAAAGAVLGALVELLRRHLPLASLLPAVLIWPYLLAPPDAVNPLRGAILIGGALALSAALALPPADWLSHRQARREAALVGATTLAAYLITLQRTIGRADTFEFQVTAPVLGVAHPTGYPLYILLGKLFSLAIPGSAAVAVNTTSAAAAAAAVIALYLVLRCILGIEPIPAGLAALTFAFSPIFWSQAVIAEVYALHNAFAAAILGLSLSLLAGGSSPQRVILLGGLIGLSLTNHLTTVLLLPAVAVALAHQRLTLRQWALAGGALIAGLLVYLYIPLRWPALHDGRLMRPDEFIGWVSGSRFSGALQMRAWLDDPERWRIVARLLLAQMGWPGLIASACGLALLAARRWQAALVMALAFAAYFFYGLNYLVPDIGVFLIPLFLLQAIWIGYAAGVLIELMSRRSPKALSLWLQAAALTLLAWLPLQAVWTTGPTFDWSDEQALEAWGRRVLALPLDADAAILADSEKVAPLEYLHRIEGLRPDIEVVVLGTEAEYQVDLRERLAAGQTVYLARFLPGLEGTYHLRAMGPLVEVSAAPLRVVPDLSGTPAEWQNGIVLLGAELPAAPVLAGEDAWVTLYWQGAAGLTDNVHMRQRLVDADGQVVWQGQPAYPVSGRYPPVAWKDGEIIPDFTAIPVPGWLPPGSYRLQVGLGPPFSPDSILLRDGSEWATAAALEVVLPGGRLESRGRRSSIAAPGGVLLFTQAPERAPEGGVIRLSAGWRTPELDREVAAAWTGDAVSGGELPGSPARLAAARGEGDPAVVIWQIAGGPLRCGWLQPLRDRCELARTTLAGSATAQAIANFDNRMLLEAVSFEAGRLQPGQIVEVTLTWQGLARMDQDYTVFVHLLGPDGRVHGQIDAWPVQGTYPTSTWPPGERISDRYAVPLDADAPPGSYQLEIGVYLLATNTRLPVVDAGGTAIDDRILLEGLLLEP